MKQIDACAPCLICLSPCFFSAVPVMVPVPVAASKSAQPQPVAGGWAAWRCRRGVICNVQNGASEMVPQPLKPPMRRRLY